MATNIIGNTFLLAEQTVQTTDEKDVNSRLHANGTDTENGSAKQVLQYPPLFLKELLLKES